MKILGVSASLRNSRFGKGSEILAKEISRIESREHLDNYLQSQSNIRLSAFIEAGRKEKKTFDEIYRNLKKLPGKYGLSNSEIMLAAALWGAKENGCEIEHASLGEYFGDRGGARLNTDGLLDRVNSADGLILSGPVYFGDRSSLLHDFLQLLRLDKSVVENKIIAGLAVGAKRNGGQETCLIYQMMDFIDLNMFGVGNDSETTAQYGGTGHAGDVGTCSDDAYGINTSVGTGRRLAHVLKFQRYGTETISKFKDKPDVGVIVLQDADGRARDFVEKYLLNSELSETARLHFFYFPTEKVNRCIACDICPTEVGDDFNYRCIIKDKNDLFVKNHKRLADLDALIIGGYSPVTFTGLQSVYQAFMERTRYIRRSDYIYSDHLVAPLVFQEIGSRENLQTRIITSFIRHHTIMNRPIIFDFLNGEVINFETTFKELVRFAKFSAKFTAGRIIGNSEKKEYTGYRPFGYTLSSEKDREPETVEKRRVNLDLRQERYLDQRKSRFVK